jgi:hypothetical protein
MTCHAHRCCRRSTSTSDATSLDYVLLAAREDNVIEGAATMLRGFGATPQRHELGLRLNCRGEHWRAALAHLSDTLAGPARRGLRIALIAVGADQAAYHKALILALPLDEFVRTICPTPAAATTGHERLSDVFKGESLE